MPASDQQGDRFDLERRLLKEPHGFPRAHVAPMLMNRSTAKKIAAKAKNPMETVLRAA